MVGIRVLFPSCRSGVQAQQVGGPPHRAADHSGINVMPSRSPMNRDGMMRNDTKPHTGHMHIQNILYDRKSRFIVSLTFVVEF